MAGRVAEMRGDAIISPCGTYRYLLTRNWGMRQYTDGREKTLCIVMLNPSTADAERNDPTVTRCIKRASLLGFGSLEVVNLFALRSTDPAEIKKHPDPIGPENDQHIIASAKASGMVICAWSDDGAYLNRGDKVRKLLSDAGIKPFALKVNKTGQPAHPLYLPYSQMPLRFA